MPDYTPEPDPQITAWALAALGEHKNQDEIILQLCELFNWDWDQAEAFVEELQLTNAAELGRKRNRLIYPIGITIILGGFAALAYGLWLTLQILAGIFNQPRNEFFIGVRLYDLFNISPFLLGIIATGLLMIAGGAWGIGRAIGDRLS